MAFNYANVENMLPFFGSIANANTAAAMSQHPNFINQLAAAITTAAVGPTANSTQQLAGAANQRCVKTPEATSSSKSNTTNTARMKPNQGIAPMDLENDSDLEFVPATTASASLETTTRPLNQNMFFNGLMSANMNAASGTGAGYMFFPNAPPSATTSTQASLLMDPSAMMAAAVQQMQHSYAGYASMAENSADGNQVSSTITEPYAPAAVMKEIIKTKSCMLFPPNPNAPPPTIRERPQGCRTVFVGGLPENISEEIIREIFESCGEITTLRMSKKNFCHIRYRQEASIDRAIYLSGYRVSMSNVSENVNYGRLHVDYARARDDQYEFECKQRQLQREQRHRERMSLDRKRSQSPPPLPHYTDHEASLAAESLRNNDTFLKAVQMITVWLERGDCNKRNANMFYSMIQSTHAHVRRLNSDKQHLEEELRKSRETYRKQMLVMSTQFTQIEKVFSAASHKKVWDHFTKAQRKNIDQWKKLATELRSVQITDDEMEMSDDDRDYPSGNAKKTRYDVDGLKEENDSLRCQLEALRNEMCLDRTDLKYDSDFREKQIKVLQETIRNMQTQLLQTKVREQKDARMIEQLERKLKNLGVKQLLLKTKIKETTIRLKDREASVSNSETSDNLQARDQDDLSDSLELKDAHNENNNNNQKQQHSRSAKAQDNTEVIDIDVDDDVRIIETTADVVELLNDNDEAESQLLATKQQLNGSLQKSNNIAKDTKVEQSTLLTQCDAKVIALVSAFLVVQPCGASSDAICDYLERISKSCRLPKSRLEHLLKCYTNLFKAEDVMGTDTKVIPNWLFCGFAELPNSLSQT